MRQLELKKIWQAKKNLRYHRGARSPSKKMLTNCYRKIHKKIEKQNSQTKLTKIYTLKLHEILSCLHWQRFFKLVFSSTIKRCQKIEIGSNRFNYTKFDLFVLKKCQMISLLYQNSDFLLLTFFISPIFLPELAKNNSMWRAKNI